jgi:Arc/MetJ family transcription regulator
MSVTAVDIDDDALEQARQILQTGTKKETVNAALREVIRTHAAQDLLEALTGDAIDYDDHETLRREAWGYSASEGNGG